MSRSNGRRPGYRVALTLEANSGASMSRKKKAVAAGATAAEAASAVKEHPVVQRALTDQEVRDNVKVAYDSARAAYERLAKAKKPPKALLDDAKLHSELQNAATALRDVGTALQGKSGKAAKKAKKKGGLGRKLMIIVVGGAVALAVSADLRNKVLDALFGAEEEFDYTSSTAPASPPPTAAPTPSGTPAPPAPVSEETTGNGTAEAAEQQSSS